MKYTLKIIFLMILFFSLHSTLQARIKIEDGKYHLRGQIKKCSAETKNLCLVVYPKTRSEVQFVLLPSEWDVSLNSLIGAEIEANGKVSAQTFQLQEPPKIATHQIEKLNDSTSHLRRFL